MFFPKSHLDKCAQALQKCPNPGCLAYIQRKFLEQHFLECPKSSNGNSTESIAERDDEYFVLEQNITLLRSALHEEIRQRHRLIADVGSLRKAFAEQSEHHAIESDAFHRKFQDIAEQCKVKNESIFRFVKLCSLLSADESSVR